MEQQGKTLGAVLAAFWGIFKSIFLGLAECDWVGFGQTIFTALVCGAVGWVGAHLMQKLFKKTKL